MKKIIFIPGFTGGKRHLLVIKPLLGNFKVIYFNYNTGLYEKVEEIANQLKKFINKNTSKKEKVSIIALSAGGVIADYYLKYIDNKKVEKFVAICSPFKGTYVSSLFSKKRLGLQQMKKNSLFLKKLSKKKIKKVKIESIWCKYDILIPGISGKYVNPKHTWFFIHPLIQYNPTIIKEIKSFLEK